MVRRVLLAAACVGAISGLAQAADAPRPVVIAAPSNSLLYSGDFSVGAQYTWWRGSDGYWSPESGVGVNGYARLLIPLGGGTSAQLDAGYATSPTIETLDTEALLGVHLSKRDPSSHMIGLMAALGTTGAEGGESFPGAFVGGEGQLYMGNITLFLQGGYNWAHEGGDPGDEPTRLGVVRGGARFFVDPGFRLDGEASYATGSFNGYSGNIFSWTIGLEKMMHTGMIPVSFFARYQGTNYHLSACGSQSMTEQRIMAGFSFKFGTMDLLTQDRRGANTDFPRFPAGPVLDNLEYACI